ncbi:protein toll-like [Liolophura sinensis]|uniref:protein toll-like n=1 Tax=Liolophura sinensis TaxID=3198878 RepID=UPI0031590C06
MWAVTISVLISLLSMTEAQNGESLPKCEDKLKCRILPASFYHVHGNKVPVAISEGALFKNNTSRDCWVDMGDALSLCYPEGPGDTINHIALVLKCMRRQRVAFEGPNLIGYTKSVLQVQIHNCKVGIDDMNWLGQMYDLRVITGINTELLPTGRGMDLNQTFPGLKKVVSLYLTNTNSTNRIETLFPRPDVFMSMAEVAFHNMSIHRLPSDFSSRMPRLQTLDLAQNFLTEPPPQFPWFQDSMELPRNLSRTNIFNTKYTTAVGINVAPNLFRRSFHLEHNPLRNLHGRRFHGWIQLLSLRDTGLVDIDDDTLANVTGLQKLDLSMNNLTMIRPEILNHNGLKEVREINLAKNNLISLSRTTFNNLPELESLVLNNNKLTGIESATFQALLKLEKLHLENNLLEDVSSDSFPKDTVALNEVVLSHNPLREIPLDVFTTNIAKVDLTGCQISLETLNETLAQVPKEIFLSGVGDRSSFISADRESTHRFKRTKPYKKFINLKDNGITSIPMFDMEQYRLLLVYYHLDVRENPIECSCHLSPFIYYVSSERSKGNFDGTEYLFKEIRCTSPPEHEGKLVLDLNPSDLTCPTNSTKCPSGCKCYTFYNRSDLMLDCSRGLHTSFPNEIPSDTIKIRLNNNNVTTLGRIEYRNRLIELDLSYNQISSITDEFFEMMPNLRFLNLKHNLLTSLPRGIQSLKLTHAQLTDNHIRCDCKTAWMKQWLVAKRETIEEWSNLTCAVTEDKLFKIVEVPDEDFTCPKNTDWKRDITLYICFVTAVALVLAAVLYRFRLEIKALLFVRFNLRFLRHKGLAHEAKAIDLFVIAASNDWEWARENVIEPLCDSHLLTSLALHLEDFYVGLSFHDNIELLTNNSTKIVIVLSAQFFEDELCVIGLERAMQLSLSQRTSRIVILKRPSFNCSLIKGASLRRFLRAQSSIKDTDKLLRDKLIYSTAARSFDEDTEHGRLAPWQRRVAKSIPQVNHQCCYDVYVACGDAHSNWVANHVTAKLEVNDWITCVPDRDFLPGEPLDALIVASLQKSRYVLMVLSEQFAQDDVCMFVFRAAHRISVNERRNFLIVLLSEGTNIMDLPEDIQTYLLTHAYLRQSDADWWQKLTVAMVRGPDSAVHNSLGPVPDVINISKIATDV